MHEVAQVVGATAGVSAVALKIGTLVKLARVALLAPLVFGYALSRGRGRPAGTRSCRSSSSASSPSRPCARPTSSPTASSPTSRASTCCCSRPAWPASGSGLELSRLRGLGVRPLLLGFASWFVIALVSLALVTWV